VKTSRDADPRHGTAINMRISLLHATYRNPEAAIAVRTHWFRTAVNSDVVEHIYAIDDDDDATLRVTEGFRRIVSAARPEVTSVRNWNAAAALASGDLLVVIADDLYPPAGWDQLLASAVGRLDPSRVAFALNVHDGTGEADVLMRHPVISREFFRRLGLFAPQFRGVYCDNDITIRAFSKAFIIDSSDIALRHEHPDFEDREFSESQRAVNASSEYQFGFDTLTSTWPDRLRTRRIFMLPPHRFLGIPLLRGASCAAIRSYSNLRWLARQVRSKVRRPRPRQSG